VVFCFLARIFASSNKPSSMDNVVLMHQIINKLHHDVKWISAEWVMSETHPCGPKTSPHPIGASSDESRAIFDFLEKLHRNPALMNIHSSSSPAPQTSQNLSI